MAQQKLIITLSAILYVFPALISSITIDIYPNGKTLFQVIDEDYGGSQNIIPGTIILFHKGIYKTNQWIEYLHGNSTHHIQFLSEKTESNNPSVIFEVSLGLDECSYIDLLGPFEIRNSPEWSWWGGNGLTVSHSSNILVTNFHIHHTYKNGMFIGCDNCIVQNNYVHDCVVMNYRNNNTEWGQSLCVGNTSTDYILGKNNLIINNTVTESWGEGLCILYCDYCIARNNTVRNAFGSLLYADRTMDSIIENNFLYLTTDEFNKNDGEDRPIGIGVGTENPERFINSTNITIRNNLVLHTDHGVQHVGMCRHYEGIKIIHNTFFNVTSLGLQFPGTEHPDYCKDNYAINNLFSGDYNFGKKKEKDSWTVYSNAWIGKHFYNDLWDDKGNKSFHIKNTMDEVLFPRAKKECFEIQCFLPRCLSDIKENDTYGNLLIGKGEKNDFSGNVDFFGRERNVDNPTLGFSELCVLPDDWRGEEKKEEENKDDNKKTTLIIVIVVVAVVVIVVAIYLFVIRKRRKENIEGITPLFKN